MRARVNRLRAVKKTEREKKRENHNANWRIFPFLFFFPEILFLLSTAQTRCVGVWMAGKWDRNERRIVRYPNGIPRLHCELLRDDQLQNSVYTHRLQYLHGKTPRMRNNSITGFLTSVFISPACRKDGMEGRGEKKKSSERHYDKGGGNVWYAVGLWRWSAKSNVCVCDKTGMSLSSGGKCGRKGADLPA